MIKFLALAIKTQLNVHDLNNEAVAGNVTDIRIIDFVDENGMRQEAPGVSGRMLKHWHYEGMKNLIVNSIYSQVPLCDGCKVGEPIRPGKIEAGKLGQVAKPEIEAVKDCAVCDIHGYLIAQGARAEETEEETEIEESKPKKKSKRDIGISSRRSSRAMFSWLIPVLEAENAQKQVIHTRVSQQQSMAEGESSSQMIFNKSYASGIYGFVSGLDIERIGMADSNLGSETAWVIDDNSRKERIRVAIEAYRYLISGQMGASLSHAVPHMNPLEILAIYSESGPLPFPVSPIYSDYLIKTVGLMPAGAKLLYWGKGEPEGLIKKNTIDEIFNELLALI
ncbi:MAG TPA: DevR family CRISPR-associated autoregulator [Candidatus Saccharicenans sp.]|nr:DevR family CRISPR-associated autoregulator [Candidatus Saccharicenans sp.]HPU92648.1 DevR family CRISPR-associated autoregulator [Candidatus Saccharicenans sp.]